jgi:hypothetical protein
MNWRTLNQLFYKANSFNWQILACSFVLSRNNKRPALSFFFHPETFLTLPVWSTITLKMEIDIKRTTNESSKLINGKTHIFTGNREPVVIMALAAHLEGSNRSTQAGLKSNSN